MPTNKDALERQVNLTFAFLSAKSYSRKYLTQAWIKSNVAGYANLSDDAFRKKLNRDLSYLRLVGVPIEQVSGPENQQAYRLVEDAYQLPEVHFTPSEAAVLGLAGDIGSRQELATFSRSGWTKLAASGAQRDLTTSLPLSNAGDFRLLSAQNLDTIIRARHRKQRIRFTYGRTQTDHPTTRRMDVWGLVPHHDRLYLVGFDVDKQAPRSFRITRISNVELDGTATNQVPEEIDLEEIVRSSLRRGRELVDATIYITPGRAVELSTQGVQIREDVWQLKEIERDWLVRTAASYAPAAKVLEPQEVVADIIDLLNQAGTEV